MTYRIIQAVALLIFTTVMSASAQPTDNRDAILGTWKANEKVLTIEVYKKGNSYHARVLSFTDHHSIMPSAQRLDSKNPNPALRNRKLVGTDVLYGLQYDQEEQNWSGGKIYNAGSGSEYNAKVELVNPGKMSVRAYKGISLVGKTLTFHR